MRSPSALRLAGAIAVAAIAAACAPMPPAEAPKPPAPQITEDSLRARAKDQLATGLKLYETGDYDGALKNLQASLDHGLLSKSDQAIARKNLAFIHCVSGREGPCADEFRKAFEIDPNFALTPAEDGHPIWGRCTGRCAPPSSPSAKRRRASPRSRSRRRSRCSSTGW
jgi:hypothetical protein